MEKLSMKSLNLKEGALLADALERLKLIPAKEESLLFLKKELKHH
jgi:hypothetical protein